MTLHPDQIPVYAAIAAGVIYFLHLARIGARKLDAIDELTKQELHHNHGGSMKDDLHGLAVSVGQMQRERDNERVAFNAALQLAARHHPDDAALYLALLRKETDR